MYTCDQTISMFEAMPDFEFSGGFLHLIDGRYSMGLFHRHILRNTLNFRKVSLGCWAPFTNVPG